MLRRFTLGSAMISLWALAALAGEVKIIANPSIRSNAISANELRSVFLLERRSLKDRSSVVPVLQKSGAVHETFLREYLERGSQEIQVYYQGFVFTGKGSMPKQVANDAEMVAYVAKTKGAIGYVGSSSATDGVKVLSVGSEQSAPSRTLVRRVEPEYPETLKRMQIGGTVRLEITIAPSGSVETVALLGGNPILGETAAKAVKQWVYAPGPSRTKMEVSIPFGSK
jgi:TonB family protein